MGRPDPPPLTAETNANVTAMAGYCLCILEEDGTIPQAAFTFQAKRLLQFAARHPHRLKYLRTRARDGSLVESIPIRTEKGGRILIDQVGAGTKLGAGIILALEALGAGAKVRLGALHKQQITPEPTQGTRGDR